MMGGGKKLPPPPPTWNRVKDLKVFVKSAECLHGIYNNLNFISKSNDWIVIISYGNQHSKSIYLQIFTSKIWF